MGDRSRGTLVRARVSPPGCPSPKVPLPPLFRTLFLHPMPSPIGHSLAGFAVARLLGVRDLPHTARAVLAANLPDVDFALGLSHGGPTHSLGAALACGAVSALLPGRGGAGRAFRLATAAYTSHLLLDWLGKTPEGAGGGIPVIWPLSDWRTASPRHVFPTISTKGGDGPFVAQLINRHNLRAGLYELTLLGPIALVALRLARR